MVFRVLYPKDQKFSFFTLFAKIKYRYYKSYISYEKSEFKLKTYLNFRKFHEEMSSVELELYLIKIRGFVYILRDTAYELILSIRLYGITLTYSFTR